MFGSKYIAVKRVSHILYIDIAMDLQKKIQSGDLEVGSRLESERNIAKNYGVSRNVVREALRFLCQKGLITVQLGKGTYISKPDANNLAQNFELILDGGKDDLLKMLEVREILDLAIIEKATLRADEKDIQCLEELYEKMNGYIDKSSENEYMKLDGEFHNYLSSMVQNNIMDTLLTSFNTIIRGKLFYLRLIYPERNILAQQYHKEMIEGIKTRNIEMAKSAVKKHSNGLRFEISNLNDNKIMSPEVSE